MTFKPIAIAFLSLSFIASAQAASSEQDKIDSIIKPLMAQYQIPGMAIAVSINGKNTFYNYGVASKETHKAVSQNTIFEIGSLSKTFTATLANWAAQQGKISYSDAASHYIPELQGSAFDKITLLNLATHTSGLPLFEPDHVKNNAQLMAWFKQWKPAQPAGTQRIYSNMGIGLLGMIAAKSLNQPFIDIMKNRMLPALGMHNSYVQVPADKMGEYAQGYNKQNQPVRVNPGVLDAEAYGIKSSSADLIRYLNINLRTQPIDAKWQTAVDATHRGYYQVGQFTQDMMWENYAYPSALKTLLDNNGSQIISQPQPTQAINPPQPPLEQAIYNKTGSTGGFSTYALFVPIKKMAIIVLANKSYPNEARVKAAYEVMKAVDPDF
ncbi:beta-lactamase [Rouxiella badensis]|uniref:class C beta-lactamase n=1 Tax=Rouxiella badensis TaxID=1646377 RepID=UPI001B467A11|nr:class C beta-lactamase [Rouxiella badensis]MCC3748865.1 beta-lactamase [Rouxiella badensis]